jgi:hypothetical protein
LHPSAEAMAVFFMASHFEVGLSFCPPSRRGYPLPRPVHRNCGVPLTMGANPLMAHGRGASVFTCFSLYDCWWEAAPAQSVLVVMPTPLPGSAPLPILSNSLLS